MSTAHQVRMLKGHCMLEQLHVRCGMQRCRLSDSVSLNCLRRTDLKGLICGETVCML